MDAIQKILKLSGANQKRTPLQEARETLFKNMNHKELREQWKNPSAYNTKVFAHLISESEGHVFVVGWDGNDSIVTWTRDGLMNKSLNTLLSEKVAVVPHWNPSTSLESVKEAYPKEDAYIRVGGTSRHRDEPNALEECLDISPKRDVTLAKTTFLKELRELGSLTKKNLSEASAQPIDYAGDLAYLLKYERFPSEALDMIEAGFKRAKLYVKFNAYNFYLHENRIVINVMTMGTEQIVSRFILTKVGKKQTAALVTPMGGKELLKPSKADSLLSLIVAFFGGPFKVYADRVNAMNSGETIAEPTPLRGQIPVERLSGAKTLTVSDYETINMVIRSQEGVPPVNRVSAATTPTPEPAPAPTTTSREDPPLRISDVRAERASMPGAIRAQNLPTIDRFVASLRVTAGQSLLTTVQKFEKAKRHGMTAFFRFFKDILEDKLRVFIEDDDQILSQFVSRIENYIDHRISRGTTNPHTIAGLFTLLSADVALMGLSPQFKEDGQTVVLARRARSRASGASTQAATPATQRQPLPSIPEWVDKIFEDKGDRIVSLLRQFVDASASSFGSGVASVRNQASALLSPYIVAPPAFWDSFFDAVNNAARSAGANISLAPMRQIVDALKQMLLLLSRQYNLVMQYGNNGEPILGVRGAGVTESRRSRANLMESTSALASHLKNKLAGSVAFLNLLIRFERDENQDQDIAVNTFMRDFKEVALTKQDVYKLFRYAVQFMGSRGLPKNINEKLADFIASLGYSWNPSTKELVVGEGVENPEEALRKIELVLVNVAGVYKEALNYWSIDSRFERKQLGDQVATTTGFDGSLVVKHGQLVDKALGQNDPRAMKELAKIVYNGGMRASKNLKSFYWLTVAELERLGVI